MKADPFSITAGVVGNATIITILAKSLFEVIDEEDKIRHVAERDEAMVEMIRNSNSPLSYCQALLEVLMVQIELAQAEY